MNQFGQIVSALTVFVLLCCSPKSDANSTTILQEDSNSITETASQAQVDNVAVSGNENNYTFNVTISSADTGCKQYADWWEVLDTNGKLIYRRILAHSHVDEQPFTRSGGSISISVNEEVYVRAHMNNTSYGLKAMKGSVSKGFEAVDLPVDFAKELENQEPLPNGCAF